MNQKPIYQLHNVTKRYDSRFALQLPHLEIAQAEVLSLLGPTGAGKSTLLRILSGVEKPTAGAIQFEDSSFKGKQLPLTLRRRITMVHQRPLLLTGTVKTNIEYGLSLRRIREKNHKVEKLLRELRLTELASRRVSTLSGGQTQLVALARSLVIEPDVLLLDEPTGHLDPAHVELVEVAIRQFQQKQCATIVWATHNLFQARRVADRTALLLNGELVEVSPTDELFSNPTDSRTAAFVQGRMVY